MLSTLNSGTGTEQRVSDSYSSTCTSYIVVSIQQDVEHYTDIKAIVNKDKCSQEVSFPSPPFPLTSG
jgi:hypothetical protein